MKISYMVATPEVNSAAVLGLKGDLEKNLREVAETGYEGVEFIIREPNLLNRKEIKSLVDRYGLAVSAITTGQIYAEEGLSLLNSDSGQRELAWKRFMEVIDFAGTFGSNVNIGTFRGKIPKGWAKKEADESLLQYFIQAAEYARSRGVRILLEPVTWLLTDTINSTQEGISFTQRVNCENFGLELDLFHMNVEDKSLTESFKEAKPFLWHIHVCDSNRKPPGYGHFSFVRIIKVLKKIDFQEYLSIEAFQWPDQYTALRKSIHLIRGLVTNRKI
jgi:sugar phosphate isomerase/epimerase